MVRARPDSGRGWPAVGYEPYEWSPLMDPQLASRRDRAAHRGPYQAAVPALIHDRAVSLPTDVLAYAEEAAVAVARFDTGMGGDIAPFAAVLLRSESAASSQIEHLTASARAIAEAELGASFRRNAREIVANTRAMEAAIGLSEQLDTDAILTMHRALMADLDPAHAGRWRDQQVWIGGSGFGPHRAMFVPPHHTRVVPLISDLVSFLARDDLPVLVQAAVGHAQFETIHPFTDGNGRTGRALLHALLRNKGLTAGVTVPLSAGLLTDTDAYFRALDAYRTGDLAQLVRLICDAAFTAVQNGQTLVGELRDIRSGWDDRITARSNSRVWQVADLLIRRPVVNAALIGEALGMASRNTYQHLAALEDAGILVEFTDGRRNRAWRADEVLQALDAFAARAGRRSLSD